MTTGLQRIAKGITARHAAIAGAICLAVGGGSGLAACSYNETLGRDQFLLVDNAALEKASLEAWQMNLRKSKVSTDKVLNQRLQTVSARIVRAAGLENRPWEYVLFDDPSANAFVIPGGKIGVNTGLFKVARNDDQLAAVIGHEVAHSVANHAAERYSQTMAAQIGLAVAQGAAAQDNPDLARQIGAYGGIGAQLGLLLPFSRKHELEADRIGVDYMVRAGYKANEAIALWRNMAQNREGRGQPPQFLSTHPSDDTRINALQQYIQAKGY